MFGGNERKYSVELLGFGRTSIRKRQNNHCPLTLVGLKASHHHKAIPADRLERESK